MAKAVLNENNVATTAGDITVFNFDGETREHLSSSIEYLAVGVGIPANSCTDAPSESKEGFAICRAADFTGWEYVADHRGETVYSTETGEAFIVPALGVYPANTTTMAPSTPYDIWNGSRWATNAEAQHRAEVETAEQNKSALLAEGQNKVAIWQTELQLGIISEEDKVCLIIWLKYIKAVQAVDISLAPNVQWPAVPVTN